MTERLPYQYVVLRCVPRVDREEFVNVGVVLYCQATDLLTSKSHVDADRLRSLSARIDVRAVTDALDFVAGVCAGDPAVGSAGQAPISQRFGFLKAPRSTVIQPGPVHGGLTTDPVAQLDELMTALVGG